MFEAQCYSLACDQPFQTAEHPKQQDVERRLVKPCVPRGELVIKQGIGGYRKQRVENGSTTHHLLLKNNSTVQLRFNSKVCVQLSQGSHVPEPQE